MGENANLIYENITSATTRVRQLGRWRVRQSFVKLVIEDSKVTRGTSSPSSIFGKKGRSTSTAPFSSSTDISLGIIFQAKETITGLSLFDWEHQTQHTHQILIQWLSLSLSVCVCSAVFTSRSWSSECANQSHQDALHFVRICELTFYSPGTKISWDLMREREGERRGRERETCVVHGWWSWPPRMRSMPSHDRASWMSNESGSDKWYLQFSKAYREQRECASAR